jgi:DNA-binding transcriptional MerR regulator
LKIYYLVGDVAEITGIPQKTVVDACVRKVILPMYEPDGAGTRRIFSYKNVIQFGIFKMLRKWGVQRTEIRIIFDEIDREGNKNIIYSPELRYSSEQYLIMELEKEAEGRKIRCKEVGFNERVEVGGIQSAMVVNLTEIKRGIPG